MFVLAKRDNGVISEYLESDFFGRNFKGTGSAYHSGDKYERIEDANKALRVARKEQPNWDICIVRRRFM